MRAIFLIIVSAFLFFSCKKNNSQYLISHTDSLLFEQTYVNGELANEGFVRCENYVNAWLGYSDPISGLIPRNIESGKDFWNAKDAAADNYPFMVLTAFFVNQELFDGRMIDMLNS